MPPLDPLYGCYWLAAYALLVICALAVFAGVAHLKKFGPAGSPWEGGEAENDNPRREEIAR